MKTRLKKKKSPLNTNRKATRRVAARPARRSARATAAPVTPEEGLLWEVFVQGEAPGAHEHAGSVHAPDARMALLNARDVYSRRGVVRSIWVVPANAITASAPGDADSFFEPGNDKVYRHPQFYTVPRGIRGF